MSKLYISDWHYGHKNIIRFDDRPFSTVEEMNEELVARWNKAVKPGDVVYVLGDMFWCKQPEAVPVLRKLHGQKILIRGNHDGGNCKDFANQFAKIAGYLEIDDDGRKVVLSHYPIPCFNGCRREDVVHLYGHVHGTQEYDMTRAFQLALQDELDVPCQMFNVGAMMPWMDYTPRTLKEIIEYNGGTVLK